MILKELKQHPSEKFFLIPPRNTVAVGTIIAP